MKLRDYFGLTVFSATLALLYSSCRDQDFDWDDHYRENVEYQYQEIIKSIFGEISPDQSWDFSGFSAADTVAEEIGTRSTPDGATKITTQNGSDIYRENSWYLVSDDLMDWFNRELPETVNNTDKGHGFAIKVPQYGFKITPLYTGQSLNWNLWIQQVDASGSPTGTAIELWKKGEYMQVKTAHAFQIKNIYSDGTNKSLIWDGTLKLGNVTTGSTNANDTWGFVKKGGSIYIVNLGTGCYLGYNGSNFVCDQPEDMYWSNYQRHNIDNNHYAVTLTPVNKNGNVYYRISINGYNISENNSNLANNTWDNNTCWSLVPVNDKKVENIYQEKVAFSDSRISSYEIKGIEPTWKDMNKYTATQNVDAIQTKTIVIEPGVFSPGSNVMLYLQITDNRIYSEAQSVYDASQPGTAKNVKMWSKDQMRALYVPDSAIPSGKKTIDINDNGVNRNVKNDVYIVGCEDANVKSDANVTRYNIENVSGYGFRYGVDINQDDKDLRKSDWDYNDLVLMIEGYGLETVPLTKKVYKSKRYMVEDLGYDSQKKINKTDIDFNDIVVDFIDKSKGEEYELDLRGNIIESSRKSFTDPNGKTEVTVWALGGTLDFKLYTYPGNSYNTNAGIPVFQKSQTNSANFNTYYKVDGSNITGLTTTTMYNTSRTWPNCDGNFDGNNYIWRKEFNAKDINWDPSKNNVVFVVDHNYLMDNHYTSSGVKDGTTTITFPAQGDTHPQIIAFPIGTMWNEEREGIDHRWPLGGTFPNK